ncbi:pancreatic triacylglycerol lipase isoform 1 [Danaus plexippus plexippus]|uniref:Pancreatic triacylglycerol lipase isoform 1 n=1 Tax=Danaus plexippus plexippus TaxID=278856 RepID=A0A212F3G9_DANPL|nr:pancreatic triacylglycerol lipase isoform 1 [Danaus plexippus plexippus]
MTSTYFNKSNDIRVITHGWITKENVTWLQNIKNSFLKEYELNVITVDWNELSRNIIYPFAAYSTRYVGKRVAKLLDALIRTYNVNGDNVHLIGHSLGAQVMGYAGMFCTEKVSRITGLDPARPLFEIPDMMDDFKLDYTDAKFVDIIHTCGGVYGYEESHGHADFYPNNGTSPQPGCSEKMNAEGCSHSRAFEYFDESIEYRSDFGFIAFPCQSWEKYENGECTKNPTVMGYLSDVRSRGDHYLHTKNESKFTL